jgi:hypothetical protein
VGLLFPFKASESSPELMLLLKVMNSAGMW